MKNYISHLRSAVPAAMTVFVLLLGFSTLPASAAEAADEAGLAPGTAPVARDTVTTNVTDSVRIFFPLGSSVVSETFGDNAASFGALNGILHPGQGSRVFPTFVRFVGSASPDGSVKVNTKLSAKRAKSAADYVTGHFGELASVRSETSFLGRDWEGLLAIVRQDPAVPFQSQTVAFLQDVVYKVKSVGEKDSDDFVGKLRDLKDGAPYYYLEEYVFPKVRSAEVYVTYDLVGGPESQKPVVQESEEVTPPARQTPTEVVPVAPAPVQTVKQEYGKGFYMNLRTNMLYDVACVPTVGIEFYLGDNFSLAANGMYGWWNNVDKNYSYWRAYGGDLAIRKWFGKKAEEKPLQGNHLGVYGQVLAYDLQIGKSQVHQSDGLCWGAGFEYGYSLPIAYRLNIDFCIGVGVVYGSETTYSPILYLRKPVSDDLLYVGPTKAEITLIWQIGRKNTNPRGRHYEMKNK